MNRAGWIAIGGLAAVQALLVVLVARGSGASSDLPAPRARDVAGPGSARPRAVTHGSAETSDGAPTTRGCGDVVSVDGQPNAYQSVLIVGGDDRGTLHVGATELERGPRDCEIVFAKARASVTACKVMTPSGARVSSETTSGGILVHGVVSGQDLIYECP